MRVLDLFSGIGGFSLGLERAGFTTVAFCEIDPFCRAVLRKHWPEVPCYHDVRDLTAARLAADGIVVDVICGGFPCQDVSVAGKGAGLDGERSGLWSEIARLAGEIRPRYLIVENVSALLSRGLDRVLGDLAALGFDARWDCIPAAAVGAPHRRDRVWLVAYADRERAELQQPTSRVAGTLRGLVSGGRGQDVADAAGRGCDQQWQRLPLSAQLSRPERGGWWRSEPDVRGISDGPAPRLDGDLDVWRDGEWPGVPRVAHGVKNRVQRLRALGNAVVPQIPELLGRAILAAEAPP